MSDDAKMTDAAAVAVAAVADVADVDVDAAATVAEATPSVPAAQERRPGEALIKREFLKPAELIPRPPVDSRDARDKEHGGNADGAEGAAGGSKRMRGTFKKRPIDAVADPGELLCRAVAAGGACQFRETCKFSHDVDDYMKRKEKDLGDACPLFSAFQFCRYGVTCRFARAHTAKSEAGAHRNVDDRPAEQRGVADPTMLHETNALTDTVRTQLRKNQYPFAAAELNKKKKFQKGGPKPQNRNAEKAAAAAAAADEVAADVGADETVADEAVKVEAEVEVAAPPAPAAVAEVKVEEVEKSESPLLAERKPVDFKRKIYVAPLTTVGNLPFRRLMKQLGADITCGEMAMATNLLKAQQSEWALLRRHASEDVFGVQLAGAHGDQMARVCELLARETDVDFVDLNMGCPIDVVCKAGAGSALMTRPPRLLEVISGALTGLELGARARGVFAAPPGLTVKLRTGWSDKSPVAHKLVGKIQATRASALYMNASVVQDYKLRAVQSVDAITVHGRSRLQRYTKNADWDYVFECSDAQEDGLPRVPFIGGGDVMSFEEFDDHLKNGKLDTCMIARGALIKPWLPTEIKERRHMDISSSERLELLKDFVRFGLEHWGSDQKGVNRTRRYLLEWQSFLCRYIPVGLLEVLPQRINSRPAPYYGRDDLETLMGSDQAVDWVKISEMLLGPVPADFQFQPKHKANAYTTA